MLRIKKLLRVARAYSALLLSVSLLCSCGEPGPKALLEGDRLLQQAKYGAAVKQLQVATELLPKNAQAWNRLGLAYHANHQPADAVAAYKKALQLDYKLADPHFNLGCLFLEQNKVTDAIDELVIFNSLNPNHVQGCVKLGTAQLRLHRLDLAEKNFRAALALQPRNAEALNNLGVLILERKRPQEAFAAFQAAVTAQADYAPALLNTAILAQQLNDRPFALRKYRDYLATQPRPPNWEAVNSVARQIEVDLAQPARNLQTATKSAAASSTNASLTATQKNTSVFTVASTPERPNSHPPTNTARTALVANVITPVAPPTKSPAVEVTRLPDEIKVKPAQDTPPVASAPATNLIAREMEVDRPAPMLAGNSNSKSNKAPFFQRLNPFHKKSKNDSPASGESEVTPITPIVSLPSNSSPTATIATRSSPLPPPPIPRYSYQSPSKPAPGNRRDAEHYFVQGLKAQRESRPADAIMAYRVATQADPAYFDAHYNLGLAAYEARNWKLSLTAYETALAITPESVNARFNFALALKQAGYYRDAAAELNAVLKAKPNEVRAHLTLANLCAQQLSELRQAREHYLKLLELDPRHPQAAAIRSWLAMNP